MEPSVPEIHYHLGVVYAKLGLTAQAEIELMRALDLRPDYKAATKAKADLSQLPTANLATGDP
jgi:Flp pilus assembly protein TadD